MQKVDSVDVSIIILTYKSKEHLAVLLPSIFESLGINFESSSINKSSNVSSRPSASEWRDPSTPQMHSSVGMTDKDYAAEVIIVDNDSQDGTLESLSTSHYPLATIPNINNGFSKGNNVGIKQSSGRYVLLLNPDTKLETDTLKIMLGFMESRPDVGMAGCKLIKANGKLDLACRRRFPNPVNSFKRLFLRDNKDYNYSNIPEDVSMEVDSVVGAFLLIRKSIIEKIGLLDEDFFMYGEDLDWAWRCKEAGFKVWYYPKALAYHYKGESSKKTPFRSLKVFHDSMWIFYKKHYAKDYFFAFNWLVFLGIYSRLGALSFINLFKSNPVVSK